MTSESIDDMVCFSTVCPPGETGDGTHWEVEGETLLVLLLMCGFPCRLMAAACGPYSTTLAAIDLRSSRSCIINVGAGSGMEVGMKQLAGLSQFKGVITNETYSVHRSTSANTHRSRILSDHYLSLVRILVFYIQFSLL